MRAASFQRANRNAFDALPPEYSHLYLAVGGQLAAVICISDPLRRRRRKFCPPSVLWGVTNTVMLTGDSYRTAAAIAAQVGVDDFRAGVLPADKAEYVARLRREGHTVLMVATASTTHRPYPRRMQALPSATAPPSPGRSRTSPSRQTTCSNWYSCGGCPWP